MIIVIIDDIDDNDDDDDDADDVKDKEDAPPPLSRGRPPPCHFHLGPRTAIYLNINDGDVAQRNITWAPAPWTAIDHSNHSDFEK